MFNKKIFREKCLEVYAKNYCNTKVDKKVRKVLEKETLKALRKGYTEAYLNRLILLRQYINKDISEIALEKAILNFCKENGFAYKKENDTYSRIVFINNEIVALYDESFSGQAKVKEIPEDKYSYY